MYRDVCIVVSAQAGPYVDSLHNRIARLRRMHVSFGTDIALQLGTTRLTVASLANILI